jgi:hypothetical protein
MTEGVPVVSSEVVDRVWDRAYAQGLKDGARLERQEQRKRDTPGPHDLDVTYVPVCTVCWEPVHQDDSEKWIHTA